MITPIGRRLHVDLPHQLAGQAARRGRSATAAAQWSNRSLRRSSTMRCSSFALIQSVKTVSRGQERDDEPGEHTNRRSPYCPGCRRTATDEPGGLVRRGRCRSGSPAAMARPARDRGDDRQENVRAISFRYGLRYGKRAREASSRSRGAGSSSCRAYRQRAAAGMTSRRVASPPSAPVRGGRARAPRGGVAGMASTSTSGVAARSAPAGGACEDDQPSPAPTPWRPDDGRDHAPSSRRRGRRQRQATRPPAEGRARESGPARGSAQAGGPRHAPRPRRGDVRRRTGRHAPPGPSGRTRAARHARWQSVRAQAASRHLEPALWRLPGLAPHHAAGTRQSDRGPRARRQGDSPRRRPGRRASGCAA